ncbi:hypothetical protein D3C71_1663760 [compost metagenome]
MLLVEALDSLDVPAGLGKQIHPEFIEGNPCLGDRMHEIAQPALQGRDRQQQFEQREEKQRPAPEQGIQGQQACANQAAQGSGQKMQHGSLRKGGAPCPGSFMARGAPPRVGRRTG